ncbi:MAG TPA: methyltransferase domain-containing protein [Pyrinomonadaceae bacterium]|nr:methyltransferase domain-containing protein [Pyrinomonadaceae bacterium]
MSDLSERQRRELEFYEEFSQLNISPVVSFASIKGKEARPGNSYWHVMSVVKQHFHSADQKLLDFGCGKGDSSIIFSRIGYEVFGFDISPSNIAIAESLSQKYEMADRTHFKVSVAEKLDYPDDFFDAVVGTDILHHVEIRQAMPECSRVLKKGGLAIFHEPIRVPVFDALRETRFGNWLVPKKVSIERHITEDERKLTVDDLEVIRSVGCSCTIDRFLLFSRLDRFIKRAKGKPPFFETVDLQLLTKVPFLKSFAGVVVIVLRK